MTAGAQAARADDLPSLFAARMAALGPFPARPVLGVAVSGGADSLALCLLARDWLTARGGAPHALIVDHGLRAEAGREAAATARLLEGRGIATRILPLRGLARGPGLAERARAARFAALGTACAAAGITDLLLGHHAADQAETVIMRALAGSGAAGLAGMAALRELAGLRLLRPLLDVPPAMLRAWLRAGATGWVEDPSNADPAALRARLRALRADKAGDGFATQALRAAAAHAGRARAAAEQATAAWLAAHATLRPEGFAVLPPGPWPAEALASLIRAIAGRRFPPPMEAVVALAARPRAATLAGARLLPAGRLGPGWVVAREAAAMAMPVPAMPGAVWDGRFRLGPADLMPANLMPADLMPADLMPAELMNKVLMNLGEPVAVRLGALGADAASWRRASPLPAAVLATLPVLRRDGALLAVPHLDHPDADTCRRLAIRPAMASPAAVPAFVPGAGDANAPAPI